MHILVTGGAGFIGTNLIKSLLKKGHKVTSIDNYSTGQKINHQEGCNYITYDIRNTLSNPLYFDKETKYDVVFHLAAAARIQPSFEKPQYYIKTNIVGTQHVVQFCVDRNIPLIYAGSSSHHSGKFTNPYTFSKDIGEEIIKLYSDHFDLRATIIRFYNVYGPHQLTNGGYTTLIGKWINNVKNDIPCEIYGDGTQRRDFTHVDDIIDGLIRTMDQKAYDFLFELGRGENYSINEVAKLFKINPEYKTAKPGEAMITLCNSTSAKDILKWEPKIDLKNYIKNLKL